MSCRSTSTGPKRLKNQSLVPTLVVLWSCLSPATIFRVHAQKTSQFLASKNTNEFYLGNEIQDVTCNADELEAANDSQLHLILNELKATSFFKLFSVDLHEKCPVNFDKRESKGLADNKRENSDQLCMSNGIPDMDPDNGSPCGVEGTQLGFHAFEPFRTSMSQSPSMPIQHQQQQVKVENEKDDFECNGGKEELDDGAPPLCTIDPTSITDTKTDPFFFSSFSSTHSSESTTLELESQNNGFGWKHPSDPVVIDSDMEDCEDINNTNRTDINGKLPDTFWMDMCSHISSGDSSQIINLALNAKRNTGYNGTHIWNAIYKENCLNIDRRRSNNKNDEDNNDGPVCVEERVLYRLLSALQASTTLSIATNYYPPSEKKNRATWEPNPQFFMEKFGGTKGQERVQNVYFTYTVLLRALHKAHDFLYGYDIHTGNATEDATTSLLLRRLLDARILRSCKTVFDAFDESIMFRDGRPTTAYGDDDNTFDKDDGTGNDELISLQRNFKEVFFNISSILDCVQCQQCQLHGKMAMLGYGTALKILFSKADTIEENSISRNEIVAFVNTIAQMSDALKEIRELTHLYWVADEERKGHGSTTLDTNNAVQSSRSNRDTSNGVIT